MSILWDRWGVPHIQATSDRELFHAFGWAQARGHAELILRLYAAARGNGASLPGAGEESREADRMTWTLGIPTLARRWLRAQSPRFRGHLAAFARGITDWCAANRARIGGGLGAVLPVTAADVMAHTIAVTHFTFAAGPALALAGRIPRAGSNAWAVGPRRTAEGHALLLANPHLPWSGRFLFTEAHLRAPGLDLSGVTLVGLPVIAIGFNDHVAWTHTVNTLMSANLYRVRADGDGYMVDGHRRRVSVRTHRAAGVTYTSRRTVHGPVVALDKECVYALRVAGLDRPGLLEQWWDMGRADSVRALEAVVSRLRLPMMNVLAADTHGHTLYVDNGLIGVRPRGDWPYWSGVIPGDRTDEIWRDYHAYGELPRVLDPESGFLQNCNDPPWSCTWPAVLSADDYPPYFAPREVGLRPQRSLALLAAAPRLTLERMIELKHDTRSELAERVLDDLVAAARRSGLPLAAEAAAVLTRWDRRLEASSRGAALFLAWRRAMPPDGPLHAVPWSAADPLGTPRGIADPAAAVRALEQAAAATHTSHGALDVPWGDTVRLCLGSWDLPANGGPGDELGVFRSLDVQPGQGGRLEVVDGDTWVAAIEMSSPIRARGLLSYGNSSTPGSPHHGDQLPLFARKELRPILRTDDEIEASLEDRESRGCSARRGRGAPRRTTMRV